MLAFAQKQAYNSGMVWWIRKIRVPRKARQFPRLYSGTQEMHVILRSREHISFLLLYIYKHYGI